MRIVYAIPVRHIEVLADMTLGAMGIETNILTVPALPTPMTTAMIVAVAGPHIEAQADHELRVRVLDPEFAEASAPLTAEYGITPGPNTPAGWEVRSVFPMSVHFEATAEGTYSIEVATDDGQPVSVPIIIRVAQT